MKKIRDSLSLQDWPNLTTLFIGVNHSNYGIVDSQLCRLMSKGNFPNLLKLKLNNNLIGDEGCRWLAKGPWNLIELHLTHNKIKGEGIDWIISAHWRNLKKFDFVGNPLEGEYQRWIHKSDWPRLNEFSTSMGERSDIESNNWRHIKEMVLRSFQEYAEGGNCILERWDRWLIHNNWSNLRVISLQRSGLGNKGCMWIHQARLDLQNLYLRFNDIGDQGVSWLAKSKWKQIIRLNLADNSLTNESCKYISCANWPNLQDLSLQNNQVKRLGLRSILKGTFSKKLNSYFRKMYYVRRSSLYYFPF